MKLSKIFTFLKESSILVTVKTKLLKLVDKNKDKIKDKLEECMADNAPEIKEKLVKYITDNVELPIYLKPFKGLVKKTISKNINKLEQFLLQQINNI